MGVASGWLLILLWGGKAVYIRALNEKKLKHGCMKKGKKMSSMPILQIIMNDISILSVGGSYVKAVTT